jgi:hypothetical protein
MSKTKIFAAEQFIPTEYKTAKDKAKFANHFADFALSNFSYDKFSKWFYEQLRMCFGHMAHYNKDGFYEEWFSTRKKHEHFLNHCLAHQCYGQPEYTYSDVEKALIAWMKERIMLI